MSSVLYYTRTPAISNVSEFNLFTVPVGLHFFDSPGEKLGRENLSRNAETLRPQGWKGVAALADREAT